MIDCHLPYVAFARSSDERGRQATVLQHKNLTLMEMIPRSVQLWWTLRIAQKMCIHDSSNKTTTTTSCTTSITALAYSPWKKKSNHIITSVSMWQSTVQLSAIPKPKHSAKSRTGCQSTVFLCQLTSFQVSFCWIPFRNVLEGVVIMATALRIVIFILSCPLWGTFVWYHQGSKYLESANAWHLAVATGEEEADHRMIEATSKGLVER